jgi:hypothetical protein
VQCCRLDLKERKREKKKERKRKKGANQRGEHRGKRAACAHSVSHLEVCTKGSELEKEGI